MSTSDRVLCPHCDGKKKCVAHLNYGGGKGEWAEIDCFTCKGVGSITTEQVARMEAGKKLRSDRIARDMSLREESKRLGITAAELSKRETGFL